MLVVTRCPSEALRIGDIFLHVAQIYASNPRANLTAILADNRGELCAVPFCLHEGQAFNLGDVEVTLNKVSGQRARIKIVAPDGVEIFRNELLLPCDDLGNPLAGLIYNIHQLGLAMPRHDDLTTDLVQIFAAESRIGFAKRIEACTKEINHLYPGFLRDTQDIINAINDADFLGALCHARQLYAQIHGVTPEKQVVVPSVAPA